MKKTNDYVYVNAYWNGLDSIMLENDKEMINTVSAGSKTTVSANSSTSGTGGRWHVENSITSGSSTTIPGATVMGGASVSYTPIKDKYYVFRLPESNIPNKVYVSGRLLTMGIVGSDVQVAYTGGNKIIFSPNELMAVAYNNKLTISLEYGDFIYHYNLERDFYGVVVEKDSTVVVAKLISKVIKQ